MFGLWLEVWYFARKLFFGSICKTASMEDAHVNAITNQIHAAINALRSHGWLDIEEFRLPSQFLDTRALFFKLDELFEKMPGCISDQKEIVSMQRNELRPLIEQAISVWGPPAVRADR